MSSAKAALESDTRVLAWEAGRKWGVRVNTISAGPLGSRAAKAIGFIDDMIRYSYANAPVQKELEAREVGAVAAFLLSPLASAVSVFFFFLSLSFELSHSAEENSRGKKISLPFFPFFRDKKTNSRSPARASTSTTASTPWAWRSTPSPWRGTSRRRPRPRRPPRSPRDEKNKEDVGGRKDDFFVF